MWWVLGCAYDCNLDLERAEGWRAEAAIERRWRDFTNSRDPGHDAYKQGYETREACMDVLFARERAGEFPYTHWVGGEPIFLITITHHKDWVEFYNDANNAHIRYACFARESEAD